jgi:hypothetical protein
MSNKIIIPLPLMTLNQYTNANRTHYHAGAKSKKKATELCKIHVLKAMREGFQLKELPANFEFVWYCKDKRTDKDNVSFQRKFIFDGMQSAGLIANDNWQHIGNWIDKFEIDKSFERVEIKQLM